MIDALFAEVQGASPPGRPASCGGSARPWLRGPTDPRAIGGSHRAAHARFTTGASRPGDKSRATVIQVIEETLDELFDTAPLFGEPATRFWRRIDWSTRDLLARPEAGEELLCIDAAGLPAGG